MTRKILILSAAALCLGLSGASAQQTGFKGIAGEQEADPAPVPTTSLLPGDVENPGLRFQIGRPTAAELSKLDRTGGVASDPFFRSSVVSRHRVRNNGVTGLDIFDAIFD